jgi:hypothetical protein
MAYEVFSGGRRGGIPRGMVSLAARGMVRFNAADLVAVGIVDRATILIDREGRSFAVRAPIEGEQGLVCGAENGGRCKTIWLAGAMRAIGIEPEQLAGWRACKAVEDRLQVNCGRSPDAPAAVSPQGRRQGAKADRGARARGQGSRAKGREGER